MLTDIYKPDVPSVGHASMRMLGTPNKQKHITLVRPNHFKFRKSYLKLLTM